jgi:hypothetical protein
MAGGYAHNPDGLEALARRIRDLERRLDAVQSSTPARNTTISGGAGLTIKDGGQFRIIDPDGTVIAEFGALPDRAPRSDGKPQVGWILRRDNGEPAAACLTNVIGGLQAWQWLDRSGNVLLADDALSGVGLAVPFLPMVWGLARYTDWPTTTSATFEDIYRCRIIKQHHNIQYALAHTSSTSGTTGEVRVMLDGTQIGTTISTGFVISFPTISVDIDAIGGHLTSHVLTVQARRTAGAGAIHVSVQGLYGGPS